jgi:hypothetical protein
MDSVHTCPDAFERFAAVAEHALALADLIAPTAAHNDGPTIYPPGVKTCPECGYPIGPVSRMCAACWFRGWWWPA